MKELFAQIVMRLALCGLAVSLAIVVLRSRVAIIVGERLLSLWRSMPPLSCVAVCSFLMIGVLVGGDKTNGVFKTGLTGFVGVGNLVNLVNPVQNNIPVQTTPPQQRFAEKKAANWNIRGAWKDSFWLPFDDGWVFPWGTNHLSGVEVVSCGQIWPTPFDTNAVASAGLPFEIVRGLTTFGYEFTPSNSYRFVWNDAAINRDTNNLVTATLELFRDGSVCVTTNGIAAYLPRELPFPHNGFGQDDEWVAANFTNATEILAVGYSQWVDAQVGEGLTNGLYKFTVTIPGDPPETVQLVVGDLSVAVTNAGEYVFLLEKGIDYEYGIIPFMTNVSYSAVDDVPQTRGVVRGGQRSSPGDATHTWTVDGGYGNEPQTEYAFGRVWWLPFFFGSPDVSHIGPEDETQTFTANFADCRQLPVASYLWTASDGLTVHSPSAQTTQITVDSMPSWAQASVSVTATIGDHELNSYLDGFTYGTNSTPQVHLSLDLPDAVLLNSNEVSAAKIAAVGWAFSSDAPTSGIVRVSCVSRADKVLAPGLVGEWTVDDSYSVAATLEGVGTSAAFGDVVFRMEFCGGDATNAVEKATTVVRVGDVLLPSAPADGLVVLTNTPVAMLLDCEPAGSGPFLSTTWHTRRLKSDGSYDEWQLAEYNHHGASVVFTPSLGGIYQVRALASVAAGGVDERFYIWDDGDLVDPFGLKEAGDLKMLGVADCQWQIDLRNHALAYIGSRQYSRASSVSSQYDFSGMPEGSWKCNIFVAHSIMRAGLQVPHNSHFFNTYPPVANDWANGTGITGWQFLGRSVYLQPGYVVGHPASIGSGHCGIIDFDGSAIAAGRHFVNRQYEDWLDGSSGFHKYGAHSE